MLFISGSADKTEPWTVWEMLSLSFRKANFSFGFCCWYFVSVTTTCCSALLMFENCAARKLGIEKPSLSFQISVQGSLPVPWVSSALCSTPSWIWVHLWECSQFWPGCILRALFATASNSVHLHFPHCYVISVHVCNGKKNTVKTILIHKTVSQSLEQYFTGVRVCSRASVKPWIKKYWCNHK